MNRLAPLFALSLVACDPPASTTPASDAGASPNATIVPAPLVTEAPEADAGPPDASGGGIPADSAGRLILPDAGPPPPEPFRTEAPLPIESPALKDLTGLTLEGAFKWRDVPSPPKAPEVNQEGIKEALKQTALTWRVDLSENGRLRIELTSAALPLPAHSEIRQRIDRYGSIVIWPSATQYRVVPPGALRTILGERRVDVTPLAAGVVRAQGEGRKLGVATKKIDVSSPLGSLKLESAKTTDAGDGAVLLCRVFVELVGVDPKSPACQPGEVPLSAQISWAQGGGVAFEVSTMTKRTDLATNAMLVPPPGPTFVPAGLPEVPQMIFLSRETLAAFRTMVVPSTAKPDPNAPGEGFMAVNRTDGLAYLLIDGVPVVAVPGASERYVIGPPKGKYVAQWRTFLGEHVGVPVPIEMPARIVNGGAPSGADAGPPDGG